MNLKKTGKVISVLSLILFIFVFGFFFKIIDFLADYNWFKEVGYTQAFIKQVFLKLYVGVPSFFILAILIYLYLNSIKKSFMNKMSHEIHPTENKALRNGTIIGSVIISLLYSTQIASRLSMEILKFKDATNFNIKDPIFNKDVAFYIFKLPLINEIFSILSGMLVLLFALTFIYYVVLTVFNRSNIYYSIGDNVTNITDFSGLKDLFKKVLNFALKQVVVIAVVFFIVVGLKSYLSSFDLLYSPRGVAYGASYTDIKITLLVYRIQAVIGLASAVFFIIAYNKKRLRIALIGPILFIVLAIGSTIVEGLVQNFIVAPNELVKEKQYIDYNINFTKLAYGLNEIKEENFVADNNIDKNSIIKNEETLNNVSINDYRPTKEAYNQLQGLRTYYKFSGVDIDRYSINGKISQVFLSPREIDKNETQSKTWLNKHLKYTHGYGIVMSPVNKVTAGGEPEMIIKDIPPKSKYPNMNVDRPEIYFGEQSDEYIVVNTNEKEFDYPKGDTNAFADYKGDAGIKLNFFNRLLYSINQKSLKLLVAGSVNSNSKIILNRNIINRVEKIAPFLSYDKDPYIVLVKGKLYWIIDGYTYSSKYPYSQPYSENGVNYIRNSFKVVIDAYSGKTDFYKVDNSDPIVNTYAKIFPSIFKSIDNMPQDIKEHIRYPQTMFEIQAKTYEIYHMKDTGVFYNKEDKWEIGKDFASGKELESNYITFKLPEEKSAEFLLSIPYTPKNKQNMTALLVARNDSKNYGQLIVYRFPKDKIVLGPSQVEAKINNEPEISKNLTQWGSGGSKVIRGHLLTIPIENSILYVEPLYIKSDSENSIPEVKKIIVAFKDKVVMEDNLQNALDTMFGIEKLQPNVNNNSGTDQNGNSANLSSNDLVKNANDIYEKAQQSIKNGDFSTYGKYIGELGNILKQLQNASK